MQTSARFLTAALLLAFGTTARAADFQSQKWVHDAKRDTVESYNRGGNLFEAIGTDPELAPLATALQNLGTDLKDGLFPMIGIGASKTPLRSFFFQTVESDMAAVSVAAQKLPARRPDLVSAEADMEAWLDFLAACVESEIGNNRDAP